MGRPPILRRTKGEEWDTSLCLTPRSPSARDLGHPAPGHISPIRKRRMGYPALFDFHAPKCEGSFGFAQGRLRRTRLMGCLVSHPSLEKAKDGAPDLSGSNLYGTKKIFAPRLHSVYSPFTISGGY